MKHTVLPADPSVFCVFLYKTHCFQTQPNNITMKILLDIPDNKAASLMDVLRSISYVKAKTLTDEKALLMEEIREAVVEMKLIKSGKKQARNAEDFLNEL